MSVFEDYASVVFWDFKRLDNVVYNYKVLETLIDSASNNSDKNLFIKPIIISMMSLVECILYDRIIKAKQIVLEPTQIAPDVLEEIKQSNIPDVLYRYANICEEHKLLGNNDNLYVNLYNFIKMRNRVHIQNTKKYEPEDEADLWKIELVKDCGELLKNIYEYIGNTDQRPPDNGIHKSPKLDGFPTPWEKL